jgi:molecular chaperone HtpG
MTEHAFQADTTRVLGLVIDSLYSDKDIFLRELVSNAADALDKLRFRALTEPALLGDETNLVIRIHADEKAGTLTIEDTGIGMSEAELIDHLGTIARSGTKAFLDKLEEAKRKDVALIGQFGVGFYSSFLVADEVVVVSRAAGSDEAFRWSSDGKSTFHTEKAERATRGTTLVLHLKEDQKQFLSEGTLRGLVRRFSDFVSYPIELGIRADDAAELSFERVNKGSAPWQQQPSALDEKAHEELYQHLTHDWEPPLAHAHFRVEGTLEYVALLYLPRRTSEALFDPAKTQGLRLFVKRVSVLENCDLLLPPHLRFVRGLVDSDDLPLNVSRELLQDSSALRAMQKQLVKRVLDMIEGLATEKPEDFRTFTTNFGSILKEGLAGGHDIDHRVAKLVRFRSTAATGDEVVSLDEYVGRMKEGQETIFYATADNVARLSAAPQLEALRKKGYEILLGTEPIDEFVFERLGTFEGKKLVSALRADATTSSEDEKTQLETEKGELAPLLDVAKRVLGARVSDVLPSTRLVDSPACLVLGAMAMPAHLEKLFRQRGHDLPSGGRVLELNRAHPLIGSLLQLAKTSPDDEKLASWIELLCDQAALAEGSEVPDPAKFAQRVTELLGSVVASATKA